MLPQIKEEQFTLLNPSQTQAHGESGKQKRAKKNITC